MVDGDSIRLDKFSGLRNTVSPERLGPAELARARNVDIDDAQQVHRRRGYKLVMAGRFSSAYTATNGQSYVVKDGVFGRLMPGWTFVRIMAGIAPAPLCYVTVGTILYASNGVNSFAVDMASDTAMPWGAVRDPAYRPGLSPAAIDWWYSPVVSRERPDLPPVRGKLLGAPYPCTAMALHKGRIWMAVGRQLWATELFLYGYVNKTAGYRQFEHDITAIGSMDDGVWVGTTAALYYISGTFGEEQLQHKLAAGVLPGSMVDVPADMISPNARNRLDLPSMSDGALAAMTNEGLVACLPDGQLFNLTRAAYVFPTATRAAAMFRYQDGMHTLVQTLDSGGSPATENARFGDYMDARIVRASARTDATADEVRTVAGNPGTVPPAEDNTITFVGLDGQVLGRADAD